MVRRQNPGVATYHVHRPALEVFKGACHYRTIHVINVGQSYGHSTWLEERPTQ